VNKFDVHVKLVVEAVVEVDIREDKTGEGGEISTRVKEIKDADGSVAAMLPTMSPAEYKAALDMLAPYAMYAMLKDATIRNNKRLSETSFVKEAVAGFTGPKN